jgi:hypothetical protein
VGARRLAEENGGRPVSGSVSHLMAVRAEGAADGRAGGRCRRPHIQRFDCQAGRAGSNGRWLGVLYGPEMLPFTLLLQGIRRQGVWCDKPRRDTYEGNCEVDPWMWTLHTPGIGRQRVGGAGSSVNGNI